MNDLVRARFWPRIKAFMYDYIVILCYLVVLAVAGLLLTFGPLAEEWSELLSSPWRLDLLAFLTTVLPVAAYFALSEGSTLGATWGKRRVGLKVVGLDGGPLPIRRALARSVAKFAPWQMAHAALLHIPGSPTAPGDPPGWTFWLLGITWACVAVYLVGLTQSWDRRTVYDRLSTSQVIQMNG